MPIDPKEVLELVIYANHPGSGRGVQITKNYAFTPTSPPADFNIWKDCGEAFTTQVALTAFRDALPVDTEIIGVRVKSVGAPGWWPWGIGLNLPGSGSSGDILPEGMGPLVQLYPESPALGRRGFTRIYWPFLAEADQEDGKISTEVADLIANALTTLDAASVASGTLTPVIVSTKYDDVTPVATYKVQDRVAYIRRRYRTPQGQFSTAP